MHIFNSFTYENPFEKTIESFEKEGSYCYQMIPDGSFAPSDKSCQEAVLKAKKTRLRPDSNNLIAQGVSALCHLGVLLATFMFMPSLSADEESTISSDQIFVLTQKLTALAEKEEKQLEQKSLQKEFVKEAIGGSRSTNTTVGNGKNSSPFKEGGRSGGNSTSADNLHTAANFGMIDLVKSMTVSNGSFDWGKDPTKNSVSGLWGNDVTGNGDLTLSGVGEGSDSNGQFIDGGRVGGSPGPNIGGFRGPNFNHKHEVKTPTVRVGQTSVSGGSDPSLIQRTIRQNFGRFRFCYEEGLRTNPSLSGRVSIRFIIGRDGAVSSATNGGSDLPSKEVVSCVVRTFFGLSFAPPQNGIVTVTYPIVFSNN